MTTNDIKEIALQEYEGEPCARDLDLGEKLGFDRPRNVRALIQRNMAEIESFGTCRTMQHVVRGNAVTEYWLNEEQALLVATLSNAPHAPAVRAMLIRTFVAWRRGHLPAIDQNKLARQMAAIMDDKLERTIAKLLPMAVAAEIAKGMFIRRSGKSAGQIWKQQKFPPLKSAAKWFSNRMVAMGCEVESGMKGETGTTTYRLFDPDKAQHWLDNGGYALVREYLDRRQGQKVLPLHQPRRLTLIIPRAEA